jgi:hypothetical protein
MIKTENIRESENSDKSIEKAIIHNISSLKDNAINRQRHISSHWGVENRLH